jgi:hypothetical protein
MFCKFCGNQLDDDAKFCSKCGKLVGAETNENKKEPEPVVISDEYGNPTVSYNAPAQSYSQPTYQPYSAPVCEDDAVRDSEGKSILVFGILGVAFACSVYFAFLGMIFSIIARVKLKRYLNNYGETRGTATVGKYFSLGGLIGSIVMTVLSVILVAAIVMTVISGVEPDIYYDIYDTLYF